MTFRTAITTSAVFEFEQPKPAPSFDKQLLRAIHAAVHGDTPDCEHCGLPVERENRLGLCNTSHRGHFRE
jgi:hypothetical protein